MDSKYLPQKKSGGEVSPEPSSVFFRDNAYRAAREALTRVAVLVMAAGWLARRGHLASARSPAILGLLDLKGRMATNGWPLEFLNSAGPGNRTDG